MLRQAIKSTFAKNLAFHRLPPRTSQPALQGQFLKVLTIEHSTRTLTTEGRTRSNDKYPARPTEVPIPRVSPTEPECPPEVPKIDRTRPLPPPAYAASRLDKVATSDQEEELHFKADPTENHAFELTEGPGYDPEPPKSADDIRAMNQAFHQEQDHQQHKAFDRGFGKARFGPYHQGQDFAHRDNPLQATHDLDNVSQAEEHARDQDPSTWRYDDPRSGNDARQLSRDIEADRRSQAGMVRHGGRLPGQERRDKIAEQAERDRQQVYGRDRPLKSGTRDRDLATMRATGFMDEDQPEREIQDHAKRK